MNSSTLDRHGLRLAAALACTALPAAAFGQAPPDADAPPPLYRIEVIVFAHNTGDSNEEDFAHIARRAALEDMRRGGEIETFDFEPYLDEDLLDGDGSRLLLGTDEQSPARGGDPAAAGNTADQAGASTAVVNEAAVNEAAVNEATAADEAGVAAADGPGGAAAVDEATASGSAAADPGAVEGGSDVGQEVVQVDPFGGRLGDTVTGFRFRLLAPDELELASARQRLENRDAYTPLAHGGWIQEGLPPNEAKPFDLAYLGTRDPSGTVRLHVSRFLHVTVDLDYRGSQGTGGSRGAGTTGSFGAPDASQGPSADNTVGTSSLPRFGAVAPLDEIALSPRYRLRAERRVGRGELHYFDHPLFGVIVMVQPYEPPAPPQPGGVQPAA